ncbi:unnamed protein product (macronuclear) [Paramecium tetraurelia]|uniref:ATP-grasp domain-containing protein n=1 Tax=Paramecium tetraurelia TaxID=5888 RepID=A0BDK3_PARTE|nr:uncharacterized protein GSPATT00027649001 [Paramecium tetraurelia]CAK56620.1 unnamed protein product [Paramecium tetraurelia]|eukprot:XP_001424018.1 hypothetical protein (macronuclear) [Paramecium tetraurelia strain d4-2]
MTQQILLVSLCILFLQKWLFENTLVYKQYDQVKDIIKQMNTLTTTNFFNNRDYYTSKRLYRFDLSKSQIYLNDSYCNQSDTFKFYHPDVVLKDIHTTRDTDDLTQEIVQSISFIKITNYTEGKIRNKSVLPEALTIPFNYYDSYLTKTTTGLSAMCLFQKHNHMRGRQQLAYKNELLNNYYLYVDKLKTMPEFCSTNVTYIPKSYRLWLKDECSAFFEFINTTEYQQKFQKQGPQFISKLGLEVHRGAGITMLFQKETQQLIKEYQNGQNCGLNSKYIIAQKYINNPYLFKGHKIEFRIYFIIASTYPLIAYAYDSSLIRRCATPFDKFSLEKSSHVCNTAIVKTKIEGQDLDEDKQFFIEWKLDYLQELLLKQKKIKNKKWLEDYLYPKIHTTIQHLIMSTQHFFDKDSKLSEFFGVDFMLTDDLQIYVLEVNSNPQLLKTIPERIVQNTKLVKDIVEIQVAYLRSKYVRLRSLITSSLQSKSNPQKFEKDFNEAYKDKLEPEFPISSNNLFRKIIDKNLKDSKAYNDLIQTKCII